MAHPVAFGSLAPEALIQATAAIGRQGLSPEQRSLLSSIVSVMAPGTSVADACLDSVERRLNGSMARMLPAIQQGLAAMDSACVQKTGQGILDLSLIERRKFVRELRSGHKLTAFFGLITSTCALSSW